jgi:hypothetical protein
MENFSINSDEERKYEEGERFEYFDIQQRTPDSELNLLLLNNIHSNLKNLNRLKNLFRKSESKFQTILVSGNLTDFKNSRVKQEFKHPALEREKMTQGKEKYKD